MKPILSNSNIVGAVCNLLDHFAVAYSPDYVDEFIKGHKDYPSLSSISALLNDFNIENVSIKISPEQLFEIPTPAIAHLDLGGEIGGKFVVIHSKVKGDKISYLDAEVGLVNETLAEFKSKWQGVLLLGQANAHSFSKGNEERKEHQKRKKLHQLISIPLLFLSFLAVILYPGFSHIFIPLFLLKVLGACASLLLLAKDVGVNSGISHNICNFGGLSDSIGCDRVSNSKAATLFGHFKMSEIGAAYFTGGLLYLIITLLSGIQSNSLSILFVLTILSIPYTFFSIYYQIKVVKQICPLCMIVILVIWGELISMIIFNITVTGILTPFNITNTILSFSIPLLCWLAVKAEVLESSSLPYLKKNLKYFLTSPGALNGFLQERTFHFQGELFHKITLNPNQEIKVTAVLSLFCQPCASAFKDIIDAASKYEYLQFDIIIFTGDSGSNQIARYLLEHKILASDQAAIEYLRHWYEHSMDTLPTPIFNAVSDETAKNIEGIIAEWTTWLRINNISATPSIYIDGKQKPVGLSLSDFDPLFRSLEKLQPQLD